MSSSAEDPGLNNDLSLELNDNNEIGDNPPPTSVIEDKKVRSSVARKRLLCRMLNLCKEITVTVFIAVAYAALTNENPPKIGKSPAAYPFFPKDSLVIDWYRGQITEAIEEARFSDISFVMFYAPWDAQSQNVRKEFELTAKYTHKQITFASINCWQPGSECRRQYSKVYKWPVLIAYPTHGRGIQYNGPLEAAHMIKFLQNVCMPLSLPENINDMIVKHDAIILANINVLPGSYEYGVFYTTALRFLERDPFREIGFVVNPQRQDKEPLLQLHVWNDSLIYTGEWNSESIYTWIVKNIHQVTGWISPTGSKSLSLSSYVQPEPALILFTPRNPLSQHVDYYDLLKEVSYEYHNCANDEVIALKQKLIHLSRSKNRLKYQELKQSCLDEERSHFKIHLDRWTNNSKTCTTLRECNCRRNDVKSEKEECMEFLLDQEFSIFEKVSEKKSEPILGLACKTNRSLSFIAMDTLKHYHFAEKLGVSLFNRKDKSVVVIVDEKFESHYVMEAPFNGVNLRSFIKNFTEASTPRSLRSHDGKNKNVYPKSLCDNVTDYSLCIRELNSNNFVETIMQPNKAVLVFYYSKQCAFCSGISYVFLALSKILFQVDELIFARIDGDLNLLPWEYTMESYPTVLFFPSLRKSESRALPQIIPITVPNLLGFVLTNSEPALKLKIMWAICDHTKFRDEKEKCLKSIRVETLSVIEKTLREWRLVDSRHKSMILYKLQILKHLHLLFAHSPGELTKIWSYMSRL